MEYFLQNVINALQWGSFYAVISIGYSMVYGVLMLFNFAHGDIFMVGTYIGFGIATLLLALFSAFMPGWMIFILVVIITMFLASFVGVFVEVVGYRPLRGAPRASAAITGLMIGIIFETGNLIILGAQRFSFPPLIKSVSYNIGGVYVTNVKVLIIVVSLILMLALHAFIQKTKWGMAMRAMSYDFTAVPLMGVSINIIAPLTFAIGAGLASVAGILYGQAYPVLDPYMGISLGLESLCRGDSGRPRLDHGSGSGRLPARVHRDVRADGISVDFQGPDRLLDHSGHSDVSAAGLFRHGPLHSAQTVMATGSAPFNAYPDIAWKQ